MKQLRILTGLHAGTRLPLDHGARTLGRGDEVDIELSDWTHAPIRLHLSGDDSAATVSWTPGAGATEADATGGALPDFHPASFGEVVICIGPLADDAWPSDLALMSLLLRPSAAPTRAGTSAASRSDTGPKPSPARATRAWRRGAFLAGACVGALLLGTFAVLVARGANVAQAKVVRDPLQTRVAGALAKAGLHELTAQEAGARVVVDGLVAASADLLRARAALKGFGDGAIVHKYAAASDIAQAMSDALADPGLRVRYGGLGVFVVEGSAANLQQVRTAALRVAADIGPVVKRVDVAATELPPAHRVHADAMLVSGELQYVQTRDGTKHLVVSASEDPDMGPDPSLHLTSRQQEKAHDH